MPSGIWKRTQSGTQHPSCPAPSVLPALEMGQNGHFLAINTNNFLNTRHCQSHAAFNHCWPCSGSRLRWECARQARCCHLATWNGAANKDLYFWNHLTPVPEQGWAFGDGTAPAPLAAAPLQGWHCLCSFSPSPKPPKLYGKELEEKEENLHDFVSVLASWLQCAQSRALEQRTAHFMPSQDNLESPLVLSKAGTLPHQVRTPRASADCAASSSCLSQDMLNYCQL